MKIHGLLKPCPICGSSDVMLEDFEPTELNESYVVKVQCNDCGLNNKKEFSKFTDTAFDLVLHYWNNRFNEEEN